MSVYLITDNVDLGSLVKWCLSGFSTISGGGTKILE